MLTSVTLQVYLQRLRWSTVLQYNREHLKEEEKKNITYINNNGAPVTTNFPKDYKVFVF